MIRELLRFVRRAGTIDEEPIVLNALLRAGIGALTLLCCAAGAVADAGPGQLEFQVLRNGRPFGTHTYQITQSGETIRMVERARFRVSLGPVNFYRYDHDCDASWRAGDLAALSCSTFKEGRRIAFSGRREGDAFVTRGANGQHRFDGETPPSLFITAAFLERGLYIDTETGAPRRLRMEERGGETLTVGGERVRTRRVRVYGSLTMDAWYDEAGRWVQAQFNVGDQNIEYRLSSPRSAAPR